MKKVFISVLTFNDNPATKHLLNSLEKVEIRDFSLFVVVVDNASKEKFQDDTRYSNFDLTVLRNDDNLGFSGGQNTGIKHSLDNGCWNIL